ncbi:MAG: diguanylate cyclase [Polyangiales bacterium]
MQTVLAIDDSPEIHALLDVRLRPENLTVKHALGAVEGISQATENPPDLILLDVEMPGMSGMEVCSYLKADPVTTMVPVIFLTGAESVEVKVRGFDLGAVDYVTKPFDAAELRARVRAALRTKRFQDMLSACARVDGLTGLWNRGYFNQRLADEISGYRRHGRDLSLVLIDVDHFKRVNDDYGHPFGDLVLQRIGETLAANSRGSDAACRYGGEELALVLPDTTADQAEIVAERIRRAISTIELRPKGSPVSVTVSLGIASAAELVPGDEGVSAEALVARADRALYAAKHGGRNRVAR